MRFRPVIGVLVACAAVGVASCDIETMEDDELATYNARHCIIDRESRQAGMYVAEYGGSATGSDGSTASGAYQWLNSSWSIYLPLAEAHYGGIRLTTPEEDLAGARTHAAYASPFTQDVVAAYALIETPQGVRPWPYTVCWNLVGTDPDFNRYGPLTEVPLFVQQQIDDLGAEESQLLLAHGELLGVGSR